MKLQHFGHLVHRVTAGAAHHISDRLECAASHPRVHRHQLIDRVYLSPNSIPTPPDRICEPRAGHEHTDCRSYCSEEQYPCSGASDEQSDGDQPGCKQDHAAESAHPVRVRTPCLFDTRIQTRLAKPQSEFFLVDEYE